MAKQLSVAAALVAHAAASAQKPNIVFFITDDQDQMLGGSFPPHNDVTPMPVSWKELGQAGAHGVNSFVHTPICCPSRSETVTGRYFHNLKTTGKCLTGYSGGPGTPGECCMHIDNEKTVNHTFATGLKAAGYKVGMFGKFLNDWPKSGGQQFPIVPGFDAWLANGGGEYYDPVFGAKGLKEFGVDDGVVKFNDSKVYGAYTTAVVGNLSTQWIKKVAGTSPFFAYIAPKACHEPFAPSPWYKDFWDPSWPATEPRPISWNDSFAERADHHGNIARSPLITPLAAEQITASFKDRWRTLMSVDDVVSAVLRLCDELKITQSTYFLSSSDHGFQLGEFNIPIDKRQVYDHNTRVHMLARGPGIKPGTVLESPVSNVDFAATFLGLAGAAPMDVDGKSMVPLLVDASDEAVLPATREHLRQMGEATDYAANWRDSMFIEYYFVENNTKCMPYTPLDPVSGHACKPEKDPQCTCYNTEDPSNNFIGIRHFTGEFGNTLYAEFQTSPNGDVFFDAPDFHEYYDMAKDPWSVDNLYNGADKGTIGKLHEKLHSWFTCKGADCP